MTKLNTQKFDACIFTSLCVLQQEKIIGGGIVTRTQEKMVLNEHTIF